MATTTDLTVALPDGRRMRAAVAMPSVDTAAGGGGGPGVPGVVVVHEIFGLNDDIRRIATRFADAGYAAIAPDLLSVGSRLGCLVRTLREQASFETQGQTAALLDAARAELAGRDGVDGTRTAVIGFCLGGGIALAYGVGDRVRASSVNYGQLPKDLDRLEDSCPVVASYGGADRATKGAPLALEGALTRLGVPHDVKTYPGVGHSFLNKDAGPRWVQRFVAPRLGVDYRHEEAEDAWARILAFFDTHVRGAGTMPGGDARP